MGTGLPFGSLRIIMVTLAVLAQVSLFLYLRHAIRSSRRSKGFKSLAVILVGAAIALLFCANWEIMFRPIPWIDPPPAAQYSLFYPPAIWGLGSLFSALLLGLTLGVLWFGRMIVRLFRLFAGQAASDRPNPGRRHFLQAGVGGITSIPFILSGYGAVYAAKTCTVQELTVPFGCSLNVVQLTDLHAGIFMSRKEIRRYTDQAIALEPDLLLLTGDFISNSLFFLSGCLEEMTRVQARYGTFATLGNHEHWYGKLSEVQSIFRTCRIPLLYNTHQMIQTEQGPFAVAGIDDLRSGRPDLDGALAGLDSAVPTLLLSHRPEIFPRAAARGIPLTLSGHYHGGQVKIRLPGADVSLAHLMTPYPEGLYRIKTCHLYVSRGIGTTFTPVRLNAPPEVTLIHLTEQAAEKRSSPAK
jgi:predicted MPP superfamily phosphohydrolase